MIRSLLLCMVVLTHAAYTRETWPKELAAPDGTLVTVYQYTDPHRTVLYYP